MAVPRNDLRDLPFDPAFQVGHGVKIRQGAIHKAPKITESELDLMEHLWGLGVSTSEIAIHPDVRRSPRTIRRLLAQHRPHVLRAERSHAFDLMRVNHALVLADEAGERLTLAQTRAVLRDGSKARETFDAIKGDIRLDLIAWGRSKPAWASEALARKGE